jgi:cell division protein FtsB
MAESEPAQSSGARRDRGARSPARRRSAVTVAMLLAALVLVLDGIAGERGWLANRRAAAQYHVASQALEAARAHNASLREEAWRLKNDRAAIEEAARRQLGLMKPGEKLFIIRDAEKK